MQADFAGAAVHRQRGSLKVCTQHRRAALRQALRRVAADGFAVVRQRKSHLRMRQRQAVEHGGAVGILGGFGFEEFAPCRRVEEEFRHFDAAAFGVGGRNHRTQTPVFGADLAGMAAAGLAASQRQPRHRGDAGQPFAAKAHAGHPFQIAQAADFAGSVARECQRQIVGVDARAVVLHADQFDAAAGQLDADVVGAGVQAVFDDFLQRVGGALHHFAGGDLVDEMVG